MNRRVVKNAVGKALIAEISTRDLPLTLREVSQRQVMLANAVARANGWQTAEVLPVVRKTWGAVFPPLPESSAGNKVAERRVAGAWDMGKLVEYTTLGE